MRKKNKITKENAEEIRNYRKKIKDKNTDRRMHAVQMYGEGYILPSIAKCPYLSAKISPSCVVNPQRAAARLAVYSLSGKILSRNLLDIL